MLTHPIEAMRKREAAFHQKAYDCLDEIDIPLDQKLKISHKFIEKDVKHAILYCKSVKISTTLIQTLWWACKEKPVIQASKIEAALANKELAKKIETTLKTSKDVVVEVLNKGVEFRFASAQKAPDFVEYESKSFKEKLKDLLVKYRCQYDERLCLS